MATKIFVNLPVKNLDKSIAFFKSLGYTFNAQFTDETATCMIIAEDIYAMLLTHAKFAEFSPNPICDATKSTEVLIALSCESRAQVDDLVKKAVAGGGTTYAEPRIWPASKKVNDTPFPTSVFAPYSTRRHNFSTAAASVLR